MSHVDKLLAQGDKYLELAVDTYTGGGGATSATAEATIAVGYLLRALIEAMGAAADDPVDEAIAEEVEASLRRHPAGSKRGHRFVPGIGVPPRCEAGVGGGEVCGALSAAKVHGPTDRSSIGPCTCGEPNQPGVVHRLGGPCYYPEMS